SAATLEPSAAGRGRGWGIEPPHVLRGRPAPRARRSLDSTVRAALAEQGHDRAFAERSDGVRGGRGGVEERRVTSEDHAGRAGEGGGGGHGEKEQPEDEDGPGHGRPAAEGGQAGRVMQGQRGGEEGQGNQV